jgi:hypothetical protein
VIFAVFSSYSTCISIRNEMRIFIFRIYTVNQILRFFTCVLPEYFLLDSADIRNLRASLQTCNVKKRKKSNNTAALEIFIFIPLDKNKSCIYRKKT